MAARVFLPASSLLFAGCLCAGVIKGVVLEHASGYPLSRATVTLRAVGDRSKPRTQTSGRAGQFDFQVPPGLYLLSAVRESYAPGAFGQRRPEGFGAPIEVTKDSDFFTELRLRRMGVISGRVLDENRVGLPEVPVLAYRARQPLRIVATGKTDERGMFRLYGLATGKYYVRTGAKTIGADDGWLPVFAPEGRDSREARVYDVRLDQETHEVELFPPTGRLIDVQVPVAAPEDAGPVQVTLAGDTGRRTQTGGGVFAGVVPGLYEIYAESLNGKYSAWLERTLDRAGAIAPLQVTENDQVLFRSETPLKVKVRRIDLTGPGEVKEYATGNHVSLPSGRWEMTATPPKTHHLVSFGYTRNFSSDWFQLEIARSRLVLVPVHLSDKVKALEGRVVEKKQPRPGVPVFLWPVKPETRRQLGGIPQTISDEQGRFRFEGLPDAEYKVVATADYQEIDEEVIENGAFATVVAGPVVEVETYLAPL
ncbi:MAG: carboxypeptidase regulatory-like domain-containing protein [Bryobacterales bacterium]|nr:carboxypeptidase regulatory-like domain-containing protein [Bryobacterales bacterium]